MSNRDEETNPGGRPSLMLKKVNGDGEEIIYLEIGAEGESKYGGRPWKVLNEEVDFLIESPGINYHLFKDTTFFDSYTLRCRVMDDWGKVRLSFDLEVVQIQKMNLMGVRRKRVKGDIWHYKKLCEDILSSAKI